MAKISATKDKETILETMSFIVFSTQEYNQIIQTIVRPNNSNICLQIQNLFR